MSPSGDVLTQTIYIEDTVDTLSIPKIAPTNDGGFVAAAALFDGTTGSPVVINQIRIFDASGQQTGSFTTDVNLSSVGDQIAQLADGNIAIVDQSNPRLVLTILDTSGNEIVSDIQVLDQAAGSLNFISGAWLEPLTEGGFLVTARIQQSGAADGVYLQRFGADGQRIGDQLQFDSGRPDSGAVYSPEVHTSPSGQITVFWTEGYSGIGSQTGLSFFQNFVVAAAGAEDTPIALPASVQLADTDGSEEIVAVELTGLPAGFTASDGTNTSTSDGLAPIDVQGWQLANLVISPAANFTGPVSVSITAVSEEASNGDQASASAVGDVNFAPVNNEPAATGNTITIQEDESYTITLADIGYSDPDNDPLAFIQVLSGSLTPFTVNGTSVTSGQQVTLAEIESGAFEFALAPDQTGFGIELNFQASDGLTSSAPAEIEFTVTGVNDLPVANPVAAIATEDDTQVSFFLDGSDIDGFVSQTAAGLQGLPAYLTFNSVVAGEVILDFDNTTFQSLAADEDQAVQFTYSVFDLEGAESQPATVDLTVMGVNDAPVAADDTAGTTEDTAVTIFAADILANDTDTDGDTLFLTAVNAASGGTAALDGNGDVTFAPDVDFNGTATFEYTVDDGNGGADTAEVEIDVSAIADPPALTISATVLQTPPADPTPELLGNELPVNSTTTGKQAQPVVAGLSNGNFVAVWASNNQDGSSWGLYSQIFTAAGVPIGSETQVNVQTFGGQVFSSVTPLVDGGYIIAWEGAEILGRIFDNFGNPAGGEFRINNYVTFAQNTPSASQLSNGNIVFAWESILQDGDGESAIVRIFDSAGSPVTGDIVANTNTFGNQRSPSCHFFVEWKLRSCMERRSIRWRRIRHIRANIRSYWSERWT